MTTEQEHPVNGPLGRLIDAWCERRELRPLALLLPAYTSNAGLTDDWARLMEALYELRSRGHLPAAEEKEVERFGANHRADRLPDVKDETRSPSVGSGSSGQ